MNLKLIGAIMIVVSCSGYGVALATYYRSEEKMYNSLLMIIKSMRYELQYHLTSLPELCSIAYKDGCGTVKNIFNDLSNELQKQLMPDVSSCMKAILTKNQHIPISVRRMLLRIGDSLGRYDLDGEIKGLESLSQECQLILDGLRENKDERLREYKTLSICAGAALIIILI